MPLISVPVFITGKEMLTLGAAGLTALSRFVMHRRVIVGRRKR